MHTFVWERWRRIICSEGKIVLLVKVHQYIWKYVVIPAPSAPLSTEEIIMTNFCPIIYSPSEEWLQILWFGIFQFWNIGCHLPIRQLQLSPDTWPPHYTANQSENDSGNLLYYRTIVQEAFLLWKITWSFHFKTIELSVYLETVHRFSPFWDWKNRCKAWK